MKYFTPKNFMKFYITTYNVDDIIACHKAWICWITETHARSVTKRKTRQAPQSSQLTVIMKPAFRLKAGCVLKQTLVATDAVQIRLTVRLQQVTNSSSQLSQA